MKNFIFCAVLSGKLKLANLCKHWQQLRCFLGKFPNISEQVLEHLLVELPGTAVNQYSKKLTS